MIKPKKPDDKIAAEDDARNEGSGNTLLPMLIVGLVLIVVGAIVVMTFV